jgi:hypothetical protein
VFKDIRPAMTDTVRYDLGDFDPELSEMLAELTTEAGLQNCHERGPLALQRAPEWLRDNLHLAHGRLYADDGLDGAEHCDHTWLMYVTTDKDGNYVDVAVVDPTLMAFFEEHGMVTGLAWELEG